MRASEEQLLRWSQALAGIARTGLGFTESLYEQERFEEVLHVAADMHVVAGMVGISPDDDGAAGPDHDRAGGPEAGAEAEAAGVVGAWLASVGRGIDGYVTPKVAVGAIVGNDRGEVLLVKRADSGIWLYPTGWADVGYSASEVVVKEVAEETGIDVEVIGPLAVLDGMRMGFTRVPMYSLVWLCRAVGGTLAAHPLECADVGWFAEEDLPWPLAGAATWKAQAFAAIRGEPVEILWDRPRPSVWRTSGSDET